MLIQGKSKRETEDHLRRLEERIRSELGTRREEIGLAVRGRKEPEGEFTKTWLKPLLDEVFGDSVVVEGLESHGRTQFKKTFLGSKPAPDFVVGDPFRIAGEVKYTGYGTQVMAKGIGQIILYLAACQAEGLPYDYGCLVLFDPLGRYGGLAEQEKAFIRRLWTDERLFVIIV